MATANPEILVILFNITWELYWSQDNKKQV